MKKKIILGISIYSALFIFMGVYIIYTVQIGTEKINGLIRLHQVEILREHFLIQIKRVQSDLTLKDTPHGRKADTVLYDVGKMENEIHVCYGCHHSETTQAIIDHLADGTQQYRNTLSQVLAVRNKTPGLVNEKEEAFRAGEVLIETVQGMVAHTNARLNARTEKALEDIMRSKRILYVLLTLGPLLSLALAVIFIRGFTRPVDRLLEATRILKSGNLDHKVEGLNDEFGELASSFNEMSDAIKQQMVRMQEGEKVLEKANRDLRVTQEQMVKVETMAALGTLSSGISHELSTPLSVILNMTQLLKQDVKHDPALLRDIEVLEFEANQAIRVTRSLLGFARSAKVGRELVDVNRILEDLFKILEFQPAAKSVVLSKKLDPNLRVILASSGQIRQVFLNVILNAIQAMPDGGELAVSTENRGSEITEGVEIVIRDTGSGIPKENIDNIFKPFFTTKEQGTGLGLAISHGIIMEHDGNVAVESEVGRGTTFRIFLPQGDPLGVVR